LQHRIQELLIRQLQNLESLETILAIGADHPVLTNLKLEISTQKQSLTSIQGWSRQKSHSVSELQEQRDFYHSKAEE
jgi:hypothetical protein